MMSGAPSAVPVIHGRGWDGAPLDMVALHIEARGQLRAQLEGHLRALHGQWEFRK